MNNMHNQSQQHNQPLKLKCLHKYRDKNSNIIGYGLIDIQGKTYKVSSNDLKQAIKQGRVQVVNLTLTVDNRLIDGASMREPHNLGGKNQIPYVPQEHIKQNQKSNQQTQVRQVEKIQDPKQSPKERLVYQSTDPKDQVKRIKRVIIEIIKRYMGNNYTIILDRRYNTVNFHSEDIADLKLIGPNGQKLQDSDKQQLAKFNMLYKNFIELQLKINKCRGTFKLTSVISEIAKKEKQRGYVIGYVYGNRLQIIGRDKDIVTRAYAKAITTKFNKEASNEDRNNIDKSSQDILEDVLREASGESIEPPESSEDMIRKQWINHKLFMSLLKADTSEAIKQRKERGIEIKRRKQEIKDMEDDDDYEEDDFDDEEDIDDEDE